MYRVFIFKRSSQGGAEEQMARNGGAQKRLTQILSTVRDTCTEAKNRSRKPVEVLKSTTAARLEEGKIKLF